MGGWGVIKLVGLLEVIICMASHRIVPSRQDLEIFEVKWPKVFFLT